MVNCKTGNATHCGTLHLQLVEICSKIVHFCSNKFIKFGSRNRIFFSQIFLFLWSKRTDSTKNSAITNFHQVYIVIHSTNTRYHWPHNIYICICHAHAFIYRPLTRHDTHWQKMFMQFWPRLLSNRSDMYMTCSLSNLKNRHTTVAFCYETLCVPFTTRTRPDIIVIRPTCLRKIINVGLFNRHLIVKEIVEY